MTIATEPTLQPNNSKWPAGETAQKCLTIPKCGGVRRENAPKEPGQTKDLNDFEDLGEIGRGQFGSVHKIRVKGDEKILVWKRLDYHKMPEREKKQLQSEIQLLQTLDHPHVIKYLGRINDKANSRIYLIMEYCDGGDLARYLEHTVQKGYALPEETILMWFSQLVDALHYCHNLPQGRVLHRDLKPQNVLITNNFRTVKLGDFGLAKRLKPQQLMAQTHVGTPYYMSPEVLAHNNYDSKSDIWSLGCLLYEMTTGKSPYNQATTYEDLRRLVESGKALKFPEGYSKEIFDLIFSMLHRDPELRPSTGDLKQTFVFRLGRLLRVEEVVENLDKQRRKLFEQKAVLEQEVLSLKSTVENSASRISELTLAQEKSQERIRELENQLMEATPSISVRRQRDGRNSSILMGPTPPPSSSVFDSANKGYSFHHNSVSSLSSVSVVSTCGGDDYLVSSKCSSLTDPSATSQSAPTTPKIRLFNKTCTTTTTDTCQCRNCQQPALDSEFLAKLKARISRKSNTTATEEKTTPSFSRPLTRTQPTISTKRLPSLQRSGKRRIGPPNLESEYVEREATSRSNTVLWNPQTTAASCQSTYETKRSTSRAPLHRGNDNHNEIQSLT